MKVLDPSSFIQNRERQCQDSNAKCRSSARLQHRGIVPLIEAGLDCDQRPYILMPLDLKQAKGSRGFGGRPQRVSGAEQQSAVVELCELSLLHRPMFPFWVGRRGGAGASGLRLQRTMVSNVAAKRVGRASGRTHPASDSKTAGDRRFVDCRERSARGSGSWPDGTWQNPSATTSAFLPDVV